MIIRVSVPSRVHLTLIDLGATGYRRNGGVGFSIAAPRSSFSFAPDKNINLRALESGNFLSSEIKSLTDRLEEIRRRHQLPQGLRVIDIKLPTRHGGFGTGTAAALASLESLFVINDRSASPEFLRANCGRGGASGIGLSSYFTGGFIFDAGRPFSATPILSSDAIVEVTEPPLEMLRLEMVDWPIGILLPPGASTISQQQEIAFFSRHLPLPITEVFKVTYHAIFGALAAVQSRDYDAFCASINAIQRCAWKSAEIDLYGDTVRTCAANLIEMGSDAVAMSSIGPALIFWARDFDAVFAAAAHKYGQSALYRTNPDNMGRILTHD